uniref:Uncharacterized protein n=1 Tax=Oryza barthii TaxID=65489 RepID=A0A0D3FQP9_9ORYZ
MKRLTFGAEPEMVDSASIAQEVMLLLERSGGGGAGYVVGHGGEAPRFAPGQALGGHMRRHRVAGAEADEAVSARGGEPAPERNPREARGVVGLDLNAAPADDTGLLLVDCL